MAPESSAYLVDTKEKMLLACQFRCPLPECVKVIIDREEAPRKVRDTGRMQWGAQLRCTLRRRVDFFR